MNRTKPNEPNASPLGIPPAACSDHVSDPRQSLCFLAETGRLDTRANAGLRVSHGEYGKVKDCLATGEELAILRLTAEGLPERSVARHVGISPRTVRRRLHGLCDRLGVTCPIQAIVWAVRRDLI
jgi:DNA-binding NarL/FixJ family response regulator